MPLLGRKSFPQVKPLINVDPSETIYTIKHTQEQFRSKEEYIKRLNLYEDPIWTCQCTGHINLTHEEACQSEQEKYTLLKAQFPVYLEKTVLELVHHSTTALDNLVDQAWTKIQQAFVLDEPVALKVKTSGNTVKGKVIKIDNNNAENKNCNSPSSDKENDSANSGSGSPRKWTFPKLLPYKYSIKLDGEEKIISSIPAEHLVRCVRPPSKDLVKLFIRSYGLRFGANGLGPWVVSEALVEKYSLPSKYADFLLSPSKMAMAAKKAESEGPSKRKSTSKPESSSAKKSKLDSKKKDKKSAKLKNVSVLKSSNNLPKKPGRPPSPKKTASSNQKKSPQKSPRKSPAKKDVVVLDSDSVSDSDSSDSSEDVCLADLKPLMSVQKETDSKPSTPRKNVKSASPKKLSKSPTKQKSPRKETKAKEDKIKEKKKRDKKKSKEDSPSKGKGGSPKKKNMKQMTLFDMSKKGAVASPKKPKSKPASPPKQPAIVAKIQKAMQTKNKVTISYLLTKAVKELSATQRRNLPADVKEAVMKRHSKMEEKKKLKLMSEAEREEYLKQKREERKKSTQEKLLEMRKQKLELSKRYEDTSLKGKALPVPALVPTPEGIANELFGDAAMVTQFISAYKGLLMPEDDWGVSIDMLMNALASGKEGLSYLTQVLVVLLQTLLQDEIAEDYKELTMRLADIPVNQYTASEIMRLVLRKHDSEEEHHPDDSSDDSEANNALSENEVSEELIETLGSCELYELTPEEKLEILKGLTYRLMGSYSVQDYMSEKQQQAAELWKKRIAQLKMKNDKIKEAKLKKREGKAEDNKDPASAEESKKSGMDISSFYGNTNTTEMEDSDDISSVVKRRRAMSAKAAVEKEIREKERKMRCEQEYQEMKRQRELEQFEKQFEDGVALSKMVFRIQPIGTDRSHGRYWLFYDTSPGLYVEKGWAHPSTTLEDKRALSGCDSDTSDESSVPLNKLMKDGEETTFPHLGQNLWFVYDSLTSVDKLLECLHSQGIRESALKNKIQKHYDHIVSNLNGNKKAKENKDKEVLVDMDMFDGMKQELLEMDSKLRNGGLGGVDNLQEWTKLIEGATGVSELAARLLELKEGVMEKFLKGLMATYKSKPASKKVKEETEEKEEDKSDEAVEEKYCPFLEKWREAVTSCTTLSRLHFLLGMLDSCIKWEKSAENAKCKICRKKGDDVKMLLCDDCNQPFHLFCLRPAILEVPKGDWFCPACVPISKRQCRRNTNYRELAGESESEEMESEEENSDEEESEDEEIKHDNNCIICGGDEGLALCSTCPSAFHMECHTPPLKHMPRSTTWVCIQCKTGKRIKKKKSIWLPTPATPAESADEESVSEVDDGKRRTRSRKKETSSEYEEEDENADVEEESEEESEEEDEEEDEDCLPSRKSSRISTGSRSRGSAKSSETRRSTSKSRRSSGKCEDTSPRRLSGRGTENSSRRISDELPDKEHQHILEILQRISRHRFSWPFQEPVDAEEVPDYYTIIKRPIDLQKIRVKFSEGLYRGEAQDFLDDVALMFNNACEYNKSDSEVGKCVPQLEKVFTDLVQRQLPHCTYNRQPKDTILNDHAYSARRRVSR